MKATRLLPWVGWNSGLISFVLLEPGGAGRRRPNAVLTGDPFVEVTKLWWDRFAADRNWAAAAQLARLCSQQRPLLYYGWENLAWALHRLDRTKQAYRTLAPLLKGLKLPGPPSGRAAYCLACFCAALGRDVEAARWLRLAHTLAEDRGAFRVHALHEPDLRSIWPGLSEFHEEALGILG